MIVRHMLLVLVAIPMFAAPPTAAQKKLIERGKYIVNTAACNDCHSPKVDAMMTPDSKRLLSGRPSTTMAPSQATNEIRASLDLTAWSGPWGISYAANLTPDKTTGIGARYTEAKFIKTIRTGKKPEGEDLLPPMPWTVYRNFTDDDLKAIFAYLMTLPPVTNNVKSAAPAK
jgi:cytochrome c553